MTETGASGGIAAALAATRIGGAGLPLLARCAMISSGAAEAWDRTKDTTSIAILEAYIRRFGDSYYGDLAKVRLADLKKQAELADLLRPGREFRDCTEVCPEMVVLPAGGFTMGSNEYDSEKPPHTVRIARPFAVGKFEVTFAEWEACVAGGGCRSNPSPSDQGWGKVADP